MSNELIGVRDAARRLGVSYATLKQWIYKGTRYAKFARLLTLDSGRWTPLDPKRPWTFDS